MILRGLALLGRGISHAVEDAALIGMVQMEHVTRYLEIVTGSDETSTNEEVTA